MKNIFIFNYTSSNTFIQYIMILSIKFLITNNIHIFKKCLQVLEHFHEKLLVGIGRILKNCLNYH